MANLYLLWEIPLAFLSLIFNKVMKFVIGNLFTVYLAINTKKASQWRVMSQKMIDAPLVLPVLMTKGPRWNTHAVIGTLGPFAVRESIEIDLNTANNSARSWIAVVYSFPGYKTVTSIESEQISDGDWHTVKLAPGKYSLGVRYYNRTATISYPQIKVDDHLFVDAYAVPSNVNDYYHSLIDAKNWFFSSLHYYIFTILKLRDYLPDSFVRREYLPMGAPATHFAYNYLESQQALKITVASAIIEQFDVYFTLYDRSSLPLNWCIITETEYLLSPLDNKGYFLLRVRPKPEHVDTKIEVDSSLRELTRSIQHWQLSD